MTNKTFRHLNKLFYLSKKTFKQGESFDKNDKRVIDWNKFILNETLNP